MHYYRYHRYGDLHKRGPHRTYDDSTPIGEHLVQKFLRGIRKLGNGCWVCDTATPNPKTGYCEVMIQRGKRGVARAYVHRLSYRHFKGAIPRRRHICHSCDNPPCCNPEHLFAGTRRDNMQDMVDKGRHYRGHNNRPAFLTDVDVLAIYQMRDAGELSQYQIGRRFGINERYVWLIVHGRRWRHLYKKHEWNSVNPSRAPPSHASRQRKA
jgi:hypothetical protein